MNRHEEALLKLKSGTVIPATPLALDDNRCFDEETQKLLMKYLKNLKVIGKFNRWKIILLHIHFGRILYQNIQMVII